MRTETYTALIRETLADALRHDPRVFLLGEDIGAYGGAFGVTRGLLDEFGPERVRDTPISEATIVGMAIGAALSGLRPVVEIMFMDFLTLALDQLVNQAAKLRYIHGGRQTCPFVLRTPTGGGRGYGATHSQCLESLLFSVPGLHIACPATAADASGLLQSALLGANPVVFCEHKLLYPRRFEVSDGLPPPLPFGQARVAREGTDLTLVAWSHMVTVAEQAAEQLAGEEISAEVIDLRTLAPLDMATVLASAERTGRVLIVEEGPTTGGIAGEIGFRIQEQLHDRLSAPVRRIAAADCPVPAARTLEAVVLPSAATVAEAALELATL